MNQLNAAGNSLIQLLAGAMAQSQADTVNRINAEEAAKDLPARQWREAFLSQGIDQYLNSVAQSGQREAASAGWLANMQAASDAAGPGPELSLQQRWTSYVSSGRAAEHFERALKETAMLSVTVVAGGLPGAGVRAGLAAGERGLLRGAAESRLAMTGRGWADPGPVRFQGVWPTYDPTGFRWGVSGATSIERTALEAHELTHISQFQTRPWTVFWATQPLPGRSAAMWSLERQAYQVQAAVMQRPYSFFSPLQSGNTIDALGTDLIYGGAAVGTATWYWWPDKSQ